MVVSDPSLAPLGVETDVTLSLTGLTGSGVRIGAINIVISTEDPTYQLLQLVAVPEGP
jgi:hypothetical protein